MRFILPGSDWISHRIIFTFILDGELFSPLSLNTFLVIHVFNSASWLYLLVSTGSRISITVLGRRLVSDVHEIVCSFMMLLLCFVSYTYSTNTVILI